MMSGGHVIANPASLCSDDGEQASTEVADTSPPGALAVRFASGVTAAADAAALMRPSPGGAGTADVGEPAVAAIAVVSAAGEELRRATTSPSLSVSLNALGVLDRGAGWSAGPGIKEDLHIHALP